MTENDLALRVRTLSEQWRLTLGPRFGATPGTPGNFVAPALQDQRTRCVLKVSKAIDDIRAEAAALATWAGNAAARLLAADVDAGGLLLEWVQPGDMLSEIVANDDEAATRIAARLLRALWQPPPPKHALTSLERWCAAYDRNRAALARGVPGFPAELFLRADALRSELLASTTNPVVLHGDLHHFNILRASRSPGWLVIDPKGLCGDRTFDVCQFLMNPRPVPLGAKRRRVEIFCDELSLDPLRTRQWCLVHAVLNACWAFEDGDDFAPRVAYAQQMLEL